MFRFLVKRLIHFFIICLVMSFFAYALYNSAPGDIVTFRSPIGMNSSPEAQAMRHLLGLDKPLGTRYFIWLKNVLSGDLGLSYDSGLPVFDVIKDRLGHTLALTCTALLLSSIVSIFLAIFATFKKNTVWEKFIDVITLLGVSIPDFWIGGMLAIVFKHHFSTLVFIGAEKNTFTNEMLHMLFPVLLMSMTFTALSYRYIKKPIEDTMKQDFIMTARSKGLSEKKVILKHGLKNSLFPLITFIGVSIPTLLGSAVIVESVFKWNGIGALMIDASYERDYPILMGITLATIFIIVLGATLADLCYGLVDPRVKYN